MDKDTKETIVYHVLIVEDDAVNRAFLRTVISWEKYGFVIANEAENGKTGLALLLNHPDIQIVITDMKMPVMGGLELISAIREKELPVTVVALSSYEEYGLVREAFKLGVEDYLLKSHLNKAEFGAFLTKLHQKLEVLDRKRNKMIKTATLWEFYTKQEPLPPNQYDDCIFLLIHISNLEEIKKRYNDLEEELFLPMENILRQIKRINSYCDISMFYNQSILLCYHVPEGTQPLMEGLCSQILRVLEDYMSIQATVAVTDRYQKTDGFFEGIHQVQKLIQLRYLLGNHRIICTEDALWYFDLMEDEELNQFLEDMNRHLFHLQLDEFLNMQTIWSRRLKEMDLPEAKKQVMAFVLKQAVLLEDYSINIWKVFDLYFCPADKINKLVDLNELTLWVKNYNEWMADFMQKYLEPEEKSKFYLTVSAYLIQNCSNCDLGVSDVASLFDYQDNYFSTKFKKEFNKTFLEYLKELRMNMAKKLMETTNMKVYEIGNAVGYRNVEHFTRVFKEFTGWTPKEYILKR